MQGSSSITLRKFATDQVSVDQRTSYWGDVVSKIHSTSDFVSDTDTPYDARLVDRTFRDFRLSESTAGPSRVYRTRRHISCDKNFKFEIVVPLRGGFRASHLGQEHECKPGSFYIADNTEEFFYQNTDVHRTLNIHLPRQLLFDRFLDPQSFCGVELRYGDAFTRHAIELLQSMLHHSQGWSDDSLSAVGNSVLDLLAIAIQENLDVESSNTSVRFSLLSRIRSYIRSNFRDEHLTPAMIASACGISKGYLHEIFRTTDMTVSQFLLSNRLSAAHSMLTNPIYAHLSVSQICFKCGFSSHSHFSRSYKEKYGLSPSDERAASMAASGGH